MGKSFSEGLRPSGSLPWRCIPLAPGVCASITLQAAWFVIPFIALKVLIDVLGPVEAAVRRLRGGA